MYLSSMLGSIAILLIASSCPEFRQRNPPVQSMRGSTQGLCCNGSEKLPGSEGTAMSSISYYDDVSR